MYMIKIMKKQNLKMAIILSLLCGVMHCPPKQAWAETSCTGAIPRRAWEEGVLHLSNPVNGKSVFSCELDPNDLGSLLARLDNTTVVPLSNCPELDPFLEPLKTLGYLVNATLVKGPDGQVQIIKSHEFKVYCNEAFVVGLSGRKEEVDELRKALDDNSIPTFLSYTLHRVPFLSKLRELGYSEATMLVKESGDRIQLIIPETLGKSMHVITSADRRFKIDSMDATYNSLWAVFAHLDAEVGDYALIFASTEDERTIHVKLYWSSVNNAAACRFPIDAGIVLICESGEIRNLIMEKATEEKWTAIELLEYLKNYPDTVIDLRVPDEGVVKEAQSLSQFPGNFMKVIRKEAINRCLKEEHPHGLLLIEIGYPGNLTTLCRPLSEGEFSPEKSVEEYLKGPFIMVDQGLGYERITTEVEKISIRAGKIDQTASLAGREYKEMVKSRVGTLHVRKIDFGYPPFQPDWTNTFTRNITKSTVARVWPDGEPCDESYVARAVRGLVILGKLEQEARGQ